MKNKKGLAPLAIVGIVVLVLALGIGGYFSYKHFSEGGEGNSDELNASISNNKGSVENKNLSVKTEESKENNLCLDDYYYSVQLYDDSEDGLSWRELVFAGPSSLHIENCIFMVVSLECVDEIEAVQLDKDPLYSSLTEKRCLKDISVLSKFKNLKYINLQSTNISDLTPLSNLQDLEDLVIFDTEVNDLTPLKNLPKLKSLYFGSSRGDLNKVDLSTLSGLKSLRQVSFSSDKISDLSALEGLDLKEITVIVQGDGNEDEYMQRLKLLFPNIRPWGIRVW